MLAIAFLGKCFEGAARYVAARGRKPLRDIVGNVESDFHTLKFNTDLLADPTFSSLARPQGKQAQFRL